MSPAPASHEAGYGRRAARTRWRGPARESGDFGKWPEGDVSRSRLSRGGLRAARTRWGSPARESREFGKCRRVISPAPASHEAGYGRRAARTRWGSPARESGEFGKWPEGDVSRSRLSRGGLRGRGRGGVALLVRAGNSGNGPRVISPAAHEAGYRRRAARTRLFLLRDIPSATATA